MSNRKATVVNNRSRVETLETRRLLAAVAPDAILDASAGTQVAQPVQHHHHGHQDNADQNQQGDSQSSTTDQSSDPTATQGIASDNLADPPTLLVTDTNQGDGADDAEGAGATEDTTAGDTIVSSQTDDTMI